MTSGYLGSFAKILQRALRSVDGLAMIVSLLYWVNSAIKSLSAGDDFQLLVACVYVGASIMAYLVFASLRGGGLLGAGAIACVNLPLMHTCIL